MTKRTSKTVDNKPVDNKPVDNKPVDNKPVDNKPVDNKPVDLLPTITTTYRFTLDDSTGKLSIVSNNAVAREALQAVCSVHNAAQDTLPTLSKAIIKTANMISCRKDWTVINALNKAIDNKIIRPKIANYVISAVVLFLFGNVVKAQSNSETRVYKGTFKLDSGLESIKLDPIARLSIPQEMWTRAEKRRAELASMKGWTLDIRQAGKVKVTKSKPVDNALDVDGITANGMTKQGETLTDAVKAQVDATPDAPSAIADKQTVLNRIANLIAAYLENNANSVEFIELKKAVLFTENGTKFSVKEV